MTAHRTLRRILPAGLVLLVLTACGSIGGGFSGTGSPATTAVPGCRALTPLVAATPDPPSAARVRDTLSRYAALAWNPDAPPVRPSTLTGGLFVNYRPSWNGADDAAAQTNIRTAGDSDAEAGDSPRHDPLTDLVILRNIDALLTTGYTDDGLDALRCRLQPVTEAEFATYGVERGWVYRELIDLSQLDSAGPWSGFARTYAGLLAERFAAGIDPAADFRPDWVAESAAALTDAGQRFDEPRWATIGHRLAAELCRTTAHPATGLFPAHARLSASGPATVVDPLVKVGSQAQLLEALLAVVDDTDDQQILAAAGRGLESLLSPALGVQDAVNGGWFYALDVDGTAVRKNYKETRQAWLVALFRRAADHGLVAPEVTDEMVTVVREQFYQPDSRGFVYRVRADWSPYTSTTDDGGRLEENWVSSEATGIALHALLGPLQ